MVPLSAFPIPTQSSSASKLLTLIGVVVVVAGLYFGRQVLIPFALAVVLAFLLAPLVSLLEKCRLGRAPSVLLVLALSFGLLGGVGWTVIGQLAQILSQVPDYKTNIHDKIEAVRHSGTDGLRRATATVNDLSKELSSASENAATKTANKNSAPHPIAVQNTPAPRDVSEYVRDVVGPLTSVIETVGITVIFTLFILMKREDLRNRVIRLAGSDRLHVMTQALDDGAQRLSRYLLLQFVVNAAYGVLFAVGVYIIGIPHALLWGVLGCLLRFIPYIGTPVAAAFPMALALALFPGWHQLAWTFALFVVLELTISNLIEPWLYGAHTGISSLAILVAAIFWGLLWGPVGLILSTPLTLCLILLGRYIPQLDFLEILLGDEPVLSPQAHFYQRLLARDQEEARDIAHAYLKERSLNELYDGVLIPALRLAEQDRNMDTLDERRAKLIQQSTRELIEEFEELSPEQTAADAATILAIARPPAALNVLCVPARDEADEIIGAMLAQLLVRAGHGASSLTAGALDSMLAQVESENPDAICISALPPFGVREAKALSRRLRQRFPAVRILLGLWEFPGGAAKAQERVGPGYGDAVGTSLAEILSLLNDMQAGIPSSAPSEPAAELQGSSAV